MKALKIILAGFFAMSIFCVWCPISHARVASSTGTLDMTIGTDVKARLNSTGLGIGTTSPAANLHVMGNARMDQLIIGATQGSSNLHVEGSMGYSFENYSAGDNTLGAHTLAFADSSSGNVSLTLPSSDNHDGQIFTIKKISTSNDLSIKSPDGTIDGHDLLFYSSGNFDSIRVLSSSNSWYLMDSMNEPSALSLASDNLVAHYRFDESSGNTVNDSAGAAHGELMNDFSFSGCCIDGVVGKALSFDGQDDRVIIPNQSSLIPSGNLLTVNVWVNYIAPMVNQYTIIRKNNTYDMRINTNQKFWAKAKNEVPADSAVALSPVLPDSTWMMLSFVVDGNSVDTYKNGELMASDSHDFISFNSTNADMYIGDADLTTTPGPNNFFGALDDMRIYDRAFTAAELLELYNTYR
ncbi:MAG: LamG domain-containing protein [Planctomycetes bacterium]|nr:LamG domain-containing protein [Planctomycetota bacterium]